MSSSNAVTEARPARASRWPLAGLAMATLMASLDTSIANLALPQLSTAFQASFHAVQWVILAYLLAVTSLIVGVGRLGDLVGRGRLLKIGVAVFTGASLGCGLAPTLEILVAARAVQGAGAAVMLALSMALVADAMPKERTGVAMGVLGTVSAVGTTLGPSLGGLLIDTVGWPVIFLVNVPIGLATLWIASRTLPADRMPADGRRQRFDLPGAVILALTLAAYALAMTAERDARLSSAVLLGAAIAGAAAFIVLQRRAANPVVPLAVFRNSSLTAGLAMSAVVATVMMTTLVVGPFYLTGVLGLDMAQAGLVISTGPLVAAIAGAPAGRLVDRLGASSAILWGLLGMGVGSVSLALAPAAFGVTGYVAAIAVLTSHYALFQAANNTGVMQGAAASERGAISGLLSLSRNLGLVTGASAMSALFARAAGTENVAAAAPQTLAAAMQTTFVAAAGLIAIALLAAVIGRRASGR